MNDLTVYDALPAIRPAPPGLSAVPLPALAGSVTIREATEADLPFIDDLQKRCSRSLGFMTRATLEGKLRLGDVVVAADAAGRSVGYCIASDRYYKREDVGVIYQVNVAPGRQRGLVGAALVRGTFERWPYGVRLACCWCAQDLEANRFWESLGFVPLAYRGGSRGKSRVHIFWQRRVRQGDEAEWWYPSQTTGGMMNEDRLVLPIPPGVHWGHFKPVLLPGADRPELPKPARKPRKPAARAKASAPVQIAADDIASGGFRFETPEPEPAPAVVAEPAANAEPAARPKNDPALIRKVRELRDHYLEHVNRFGSLLPSGKWDVARALPAAGPFEADPLSIEAREVRELPAAA